MRLKKTRLCCVWEMSVGSSARDERFALRPRRWTEKSISLLQPLQEGRRDLYRVERRSSRHVAYSGPAIRRLFLLLSHASCLCYGAVKGVVQAKGTSIRPHTGHVQDQTLTRAWEVKKKSFIGKVEKVTVRRTVSTQSTGYGKRGGGLPLLPRQRY